MEDNTLEAGPRPVAVWTRSRTKAEGVMANVATLVAVAAMLILKELELELVAR